MWQREFKTLELHGGSISYICNDDEDMIEIVYPDGMLIDVGKAMSTNLYYVTVVASNDVAGWQHPLYEIAVHERASLLGSIQSAIDHFRLF